METFALLFRLAERNVLRNRRRSVIVLVAITIAVWTMIAFAAFIRGWTNDVVHSAITTLTGHLQIHALGFLTDPSVDHAMNGASPALIADLQSPRVSSWTARICVPGVILSERETAGVTLVAIDPASERGVSFIANAVKEGRYLRDVNDHGILIGRALAERLSTGVGKRIVLMSQAADHTIAEEGFPVVGLFDADRRSTEMAFVFIGRAVASQILKIDGRISEISIILDDPSEVPDFVQRLRSDFPQLDIQSWMNLEPIAEAMVNLGKTWIWIIYIVAYIAMAFGLVNTLLMAVMERVREFGLLQALGMRSALIARQVLLESLFLIATGTVLGLIISAITLFLVRGGIDFSSFAQGAEMWGMSKVIYPTVNLSDVASAVLLVTALGILASLYPALRAAKRVPVEAITRG